MAKLTKYLPLVLSCIGVYLALRPVLGQVWYPMHDSTQVSRLFLMEQTIHGGQFPPIWAEGINNGFGFPLFHFYAPLFYYVALIAKQIFGTYIEGIKATLFLFLVTGGLGVYTYAKRWGKLAGITSIFALLTAPYLAVNLYVRGAFAEIASMMLLPWVFIAWEHITSMRGKIFAAIVTTLFVMSHNLIPLAALPFIGFWILIINRQQLKHLMLPIILTLTLSAGFILPILFERTFTQADTIARTTDYKLHFVYPWQLWNSTWGFGGSAKGVEDGMSFKIGKVHILFALLGLTTLVFKRQKRTIILSVFALVSFWLSTTSAQSIWEAIPALDIIQFPWRFIGIGTVLCAMLAGAAIAAVPNNLIRSLFGIFSVSILLFLNLKLFQPGSTFAANDAQFTSPSYLANISKLIPEFMPKWMPKVPIEPPSSPLERAYYPTWQATLNGRPVPISYDARGIITFDSQIDHSRVILKQSHTLLERLGYFITAASLAYILYLRRKHE